MIKSFFIQKNKERISNKFAFEDKIDNLSKKHFDYLYPKGIIHIGHCRGHNTLILGMFFNSWEFRYIRLLSKENGPMSYQEDKSQYHRHDTSK